MASQNVEAMKFALAIAAQGLTALAAAGIVLDEERDAIRLTDYPPEAPCTLARIHAADRAFGWQRVQYDPTRDTYTIAGSLIVGANDEWGATRSCGSETALQIGSPEHPRETLIMRGNLYVSPYWIASENPGEYWSAARKKNLLVIGDQADTNVNAALIFACCTNEHYTLYCGRLPWKTAAQFGGGLHVYNSEIAALHPGAAGLIGDAERGDMHLPGGSVLVNARLADVRGGLAGLQNNTKLKDYRLQDTRFERIGAVLVNGIQEAVGCTFADCGTAVLDQGGLRAVLRNCRFRSNDCNWALIYNARLTLVDCEWSAPRKGDHYRTWINRQSVKQYPRLTVSRHLVVEVREASGTPLADAEIRWRAEADAPERDLPRQSLICRTGADGRTPAPGMPGALALAAYTETATDKPDTPAPARFRYVLTAEKNGRRTEFAGFVPDAGRNHVVLTLGDAP